MATQSQGYAFGEGGLLELARIHKSNESNTIDSANKMFLIGNSKSVVGITGANWQPDQTPHSLAVTHVRGDSKYFKFVDKFNPAFKNKRKQETANSTDETFVDFTHSEGGGNTDEIEIDNDALFVCRYYGAPIKSGSDSTENAKKNLEEWTDRYVIIGICQIAASSSAYSSQGGQKISQTLTLQFVQPYKTNLVAEPNGDIELPDFSTSDMMDTKDAARYTQFKGTSTFANNDDYAIGEYQYSKRIIVPVADVYEAP
jgi:hypothetical protein